MSRLAWLTPNEASGAAQCRPVYIPAGAEYEAAFRGAFLLLCEAYNWEQTGAQTSEDVANAFQAAFFLTLDNWGVCNVGKLVGEIFLYPDERAPGGALACDGAEYLITQFPDLYAVIGPTFGNPPIGYFAVPDLRGRMPVGIGTGPGLTQRDLADMGGEETHQLTIAELATHNHTVKRQATTGATQDLTNAISATWTEFPTSNAGEDEPHNNMPPFLGLGYFIQAE